MALEKGIFLNGSGDLEINSGKITIDSSGNLGVTGSLIVNTREIIAGITAGGETGQVLAKKSTDDYDIEWITASSGSGVPTGGITGQSMIKSSSNDGELEWGDRVPYSLDSNDILFNPASINGSWVYRTIERSNGSFIASGNFTSVVTDGITSSKRSIVGIKSDGSLDNTFDVGSGVAGGSSIVYAIGELLDGSIIAAGTFTTYKGSALAVPNIMKIDTSGNLDTTFYTNLTSGGASAFSGEIRSIKIQPDGKIIVGNQLTGASTTGFIRINADGTPDNTWSSTNTGAAILYDIDLDSTGNIYVISPNMSPTVRKFSANGGNPLVSFGSTMSVRSVAASSDGSVYIVGNGIPESGPVTSVGIMKFNSSLSPDTTFINQVGLNPMVTNGSALEPTNVIIEEDGSILVSGRLAFDYGPNSPSTQYGVARFNPDGTPNLDVNFGTGFNQFTEAFDSLVASSGIYVFGGNQTSYNGSATTKVTFVAPNGSLIDSSYNIKGINNYTIEGNPLYNDVLFTAVKKPEDNIDETYFGGNTYSFFGVTGSLGVSGSLEVNGRFIDAGVPSGGTTGQLLTKKSPDDYDLEWTTPEAIITPGGVSNQILTKNSITESDVSWKDVADPVSSSSGYYETYFDAGSGRLKYTSAPLIYGTGFTGSASSVGGQTEGSPNTIVPLGSNQYLIIGDMLEYNGQTSRGAIVIDGEGNIVHLLDTVSTTGFMQFENGAGISVDGDYIYVAHNQVPSIDGQSLGNGIGKYLISTMTQDTTFATNVNAAFDPTTIRTVEVYDDGKIFVGHTTTSNASYRFFHVLNADGTQDTGFTSRFAGTYSSAVFPKAAATLSDGSTVIALQYVAAPSNIVYDGITIMPSGTTYCLLKVATDGSYINHITYVGGGPGGILDVLRDGLDSTKFLVAGDWTTLAGSSKQTILRLNSDLTVDPTWNTAGSGGGASDYGAVIKWVAPYYYLMQDIYVATATPSVTYNGTSITNVVIKLNYDGTLATGWTGIANNVGGVRPKDIAALSNGEIIGVGSFVVTDSPKIGKWTTDGQLNALSTYPDTTIKGGLNVEGLINAVGGISGAPEANPGGSNQQIQFNNNGAFNGATGFTYNPATNDLTIESGDVIMGDVPNNGFYMKYTNSTNLLEFDENGTIAVEIDGFNGTISVIDSISGNSISAGSSITSSGSITAGGKITGKQFSLSNPTPPYNSVDAAWGFASVVTHNVTSGILQRAPYNTTAVPIGSIVLWRNTSLPGQNGLYIKTDTTTTWTPIALL